MEENRKLKKTVTLLSILLGLTAGFILVILMICLRHKDLFAVLQASDVIQEYYYYYGDTEGEKGLTAAAIKGMAGSLDDVYAYYYTEQEYADLNASQSGEYSGIGILIQTPDENGAMILRVYENTPMERAGAKAEDYILEVNGTKVAGLTMEQLLACFTDDKDASDTILIRRGEETFTVTVSKETVYVPYVSYEMLDNGIGYIRIDSFLGKVSSETEEAVTSLKEQGAKSLIIDLRDDPGGGLTEVLDTATQFLHKGDLIVTIRSRQEKNVEYTAEREGDTETPVVVLINGESASASELFSGAMKDYKRATIVGTQSFGKGIVQSLFRLSASKGYLKITTDAYYTPNNICIHGTGITPDHIVELPEEWKGRDVTLIPKDADTQLQKAIELLSGE